MEMAKERDEQMEKAKEKEKDVVEEAGLKETPQ